MTPENCVCPLMDHQLSSGKNVNITSPNGDQTTVTSLAKTAKAYGIPGPFFTTVNEGQAGVGVISSRSRRSFRRRKPITALSSTPWGGTARSVFLEV